MNVIVQRFREASQVERSHTTPHHGSYTVGQHSFDMLTLLVTLYPDCRKELMLAVMYHDIAERWTGDIPHPAKQAHPEFAKQLAKLEARINRTLGIHVELTEMERFWLKGLDVVEYMLWCCNQAALGNKNVEKNHAKTVRWLQTNRIPTPLAEFVNSYVWFRTDDEDFETP